MKRALPLVLAAALVIGACSNGDETDRVADDDTAGSTAIDTTEASAATAAPTTPAAPTTTAPTSTAPTSTAAPTSIAPTTAPPSTAPPETTAPPAGSTTTAPIAQPGDFSGIDPVVTEFVAANGLNGAGLVIVDREDGIVHQQYWGEFDADRVSFIASSSKMLTAGVLLRLADQGLIDIDAPLADVVDWGAGNPEITTAQLLSNSSGLVGLVPNPIYSPYLCQWSALGSLAGCGEEIMTTASDDGDIAAPDTEFRYGGAQWQVAGAFAEAASGRSWQDLIEETYIEPCGVDSLGYANHFAQSTGFGYPSDLDAAALAPTDNPNMEGGAYIDPPDYAALLLMHLRGGECDGGQVLSQAALDRMHGDQIGDAYDGAANGDPNSGYGMGWWLWRPNGMLTDPGAYGSVPWLDLADGYGAYLVIEASTDLGLDLYSRLEPYVDAAMADG